MRNLNRVCGLDSVMAGRREGKINDGRPQMRVRLETIWAWDAAGSYPRKERSELSSRLKIVCAWRRTRRNEIQMERDVLGNEQPDFAGHRPDRSERFPWRC
jgi:hypothetical protein